MTNKFIKNLALASYTKEKLDIKKVNVIVKNLKKSDLKKYIKELKNLENKKKVYVYTASTINNTILNQLKKTFTGKEIIATKDKNLIAGIKIINDDLVFEKTIRNNLDNLVDFIGR